MRSCPWTTRPRRPCALARDLGAGALAAEVTAAPAVVVVAAPPDAVAAVVVRELAAWPEAVVTDVARSSSPSLERGLRRSGATCGATSAPTRWPDASGPGAVAAQADLFEGRSWVVAPGPQAGEAAIAEVRDLAAHSLPLTHVEPRSRSTPRPAP